ncbi:MAG: hypothetical protein A2W69_02400 [Gammaproteobacteria bacterium RIFCSPLOWO2_02_47_7]|nr:MAG: hypothetical protein A2W69_02400 [Gammaproteobacteria bacterium RIFCSPLOWO2_02_47_7]
MTTLLIATSRGFICIDEKMSRAYLIDRDNGTYYGITYNEKNIFVAARRISYAKGKGRPEEQAGVILVYNYNLELVDELLPAFPLRDLHQIYYFDNKLWAVCTYDSTVAIYGNGLWGRWHPLGENITTKIAHKYHFNSIFSIKNRIYMAGSIDRNGIIYEYDFQSKAILNKYFIGYSSHNVWARDGVISTLSSMAGTSVSIDGRSEIISKGNFVRGIAVTEHSVYYGISTALNRSRREGSNLMIKKTSMDNTGTGFYGIREFGQINEIRTPGLFDYAHPSCPGKIIQTEKLGERFDSVPIIKDPVIREIPAWQSIPRSLYQRFDMARRKSRLRRDQIL